MGLALCSCGSGTKQVEFIPVQEEKDGNWGMAGTDGQMLFSDEFKNQPTLAYNGRFMVRNAEGLWEIYTTEKKPKKVGKEYKQAGVFFEDVAPVVEAGKPIDFIDRDGNVKFTFDKVEGKAVSSVRNFTDGLSVFCAEGSYGCIDTSGKIVIKPEYAEISFLGDGKMFAKHSKYATAEGGDAKISVLDHSGKVLFEFNSDKYTPLSAFKDGKAIVAQYEDGTRYGIIDDKGEWVVKPSSKLQNITQQEGDKFIFYDGDAYGLMNTDGEVLLRAKYDGLKFLTPDLLIKKEKDEYTIIDLEGNEKTQDTYELIYPSHDGKHALAKDGKNSYIFIGTDGAPLDKKQNFHDFGEGTGDAVIESDFVDLAAIADAIMTKDGLGGLSDKTSVPEVLQFVQTEEYNYFLLAAEPEVTAFQETAGQSVTYNIRYENPPMRYESGTYMPNDVHPISLRAAVSCEGKLADKAENLYKAFCDKAKANGGKPIGEEGTNEAIYQFGGYRLTIGQEIDYETEKVFLSIAYETPQTADAASDAAADSTAIL